MRRNRHNTTHLLISFFTALAVWLTLAGPAHAVVLKIATVSPDGAAWMTRMRAGAAEIAERTAGRVTFKFYPGGIMGNDQSVLRKIRVGQLHGGVVVGGSLAEVYRDTQIYSLPFLFRSLDEVDYVRKRMDPLIRQGLEDKGFVTFGFGEGGFAYVMCSKPLRSVADIKRQKVWAPSGDIVSKAIFDAAGVTPIPLPISDVLTGLETGLIDTVAVSPLGVVALQWHTKIRYVTDVPVSYIIGTLAVDKRAFSRMRPEDQKIVREVMSRIYVEIDKQNRLDNAAARKALKEQGISFVELDAQSLAEWNAIAATATDELGTMGNFSPEMYRTLRKHLDTFRASASKEP